MNKRIRFTSLAILILIAIPLQIALAQAPSEPANPESWETIANGIEFQLFQLTDPRPVNVFVTRMDRANPAVTIESSIAQGRLSGGLEKVRDMNARYDQAINFWGKTWGGRNQVVVGINGYFFPQVGDQLGVPLSGQIHSSWYSKRFDESVGDAGFAWTFNREAMMGTCVNHRADKNKISFPDVPELDNYSPNIKGINIVRDQEDLILYTQQYDSNTRTESEGDTPVLEMVVEMERPAGILPAPNGARGYIREIRVGKGDTPLRFGYVVISAWGDVGNAMEGRVDGDLINVGDQVLISQEINSCDDPALDWTNTYAAIGGNRHFLIGDGVLKTEYPEQHVPNSYTAIAFNADYVYFIVADKNNPDVSEGISLYELAVFSRDVLGATKGVTLDGGGSSTMVIKGEVVNNTHCNFRPDDCEDGQIDETPVEPLVANGMMMVVNLPKEQSATFSPEDVVLIDETANIRLGPGTNFPSIGTVPAQTAGDILENLSQTHGVRAKGSYWWMVDFNGYPAGWVREEDIFGGEAPPVFETFIPVINRANLATTQDENQSPSYLEETPGPEIPVLDDGEVLKSFLNNPSP